MAKHIAGLTSGQTGVCDVVMNIITNDRMTQSAVKEHEYSGLQEEMKANASENRVVKVTVTVAIMLGFVALNELYPELTGMALFLFLSLGLWAILARNLPARNRYLGGIVLLVAGGGLLFLGLAWPVVGVVGVLYVAHGGWLATTGAAGVSP